MNDSTIRLSADTSALSDSLSKIAEEMTAMKDAVSSSAAAMGATLSIFYVRDFHLLFPIPVRDSFLLVVPAAFVRSRNLTVPGIGHSVIRGLVTDRLMVFAESRAI